MPSRSRRRWARRSPGYAARATPGWCARSVPRTSSTTRRRTSPTGARVRTWATGRRAGCAGHWPRRGSSCLTAAAHPATRSGPSLASCGRSWSTISSESGSDCCRTNKARAAAHPHRAHRGWETHTGPRPNLPAGRHGRGPAPREAGPAGVPGNQRTSSCIVLRPLPDQARSRCPADALPCACPPRMGVALPASRPGRPHNPPVVGWIPDPNGSSVRCICPEAWRYPLGRSQRLAQRGPDRLACGLAVATSSSPASPTGTTVVSRRGPLMLS
jgi:hypothetical protein